MLCVLDKDRVRLCISVCVRIGQRVFVSQLAVWGLVLWQGRRYIELKLVKTSTAASESQFLHDGRLNVYCFSSFTTVGFDKC